MNTLPLLFGIGSIGAAGFLFRMAMQELANKKLVSQLSLTRIRDIKPGLCLSVGEVVCDTPVKTPYTETPAIWYHYNASERRLREGHERETKPYEHSLASGIRNCTFFLRDGSAKIEILPGEGSVVSYPHKRLLKSQSGTVTSLSDRMKKLKEIDQKNHPEGEKKPFFRKLDTDNEPLDIPDDLVELEPGSSEAEETLRKYSEEWVQPGDRLFVLGTASTGGSGSSMKIAKAGKSAPLLLSSEEKDLTGEAFQSNFMILLLVGLGLGTLGVFLILIGLGIVDA
ncbi:MAG: hypothetical protein U9N38_00105 [Thermodesulfobacteriota bacterium]|nr:hypothetical protein [Thermodesulfobacteriota bacterium]